MPVNPIFSQMQRVRVLSKKYNGSLRDVYETCLVHEDEEVITLFSVPGIQYWDYRKAGWFEAQDGLIELYFKHKWYHIWHICEQVSNTNRMYIHIAMPARLQAQQLEWVDLDLDYRVHLDGSVERLDQAEFELNIMRMGYPPQLIEQVEASCREVETGLALGEFPFDHEWQMVYYQQLKAGKAC
jgi:protein associated with RNAse G/E